jgi:hypothetical protein
MYKDEIIAEVWRNREAFARQHQHNLNEMVAALRRQEQQHPERLVSLTPRPARSIAGASGSEHLLQE